MTTQIKQQTIESYITELRLNSIQGTAFVIGVSSWLMLAWSLWPTVTTEPDRLVMRPISLLLLLVTMGVYFVESRLILREILLVSGTLVSGIWLMIASQKPESAILIIVPIALISVLWGRRPAAALTIAFLIFSTVTLPALGIFSTNEILLPLVIVVILAVVIATVIGNLYILLDLSVKSMEIALHNQNEARNRRAELVQALKSLDIARQNLQRANHALQIAQRRADEARQLKQQFAQAISHELRTPLNLIIGFTESMVKSPEYYGQQLPTNYARDLSIVYRNATHLQNLVNDVLDLARIEASQMVLQMDTVDLDMFLTEISHIAASLTRSYKLSYELETQPGLPSTIWMDSVRIKQVLYNLFSNAVRFTATGGIRLQVYQEGNQTIFSVIDTGIGIAPENLETIFEPFRQLENPMRRQAEGAGLGLSISRELVVMHGGHLSVESEPGRGSRFFFNIPVTTSTDMHSDITNKRTDQNDNRDVVLLITQSTATSALISRHLNSYETLVVNNMDQAQIAMKQVIPQAIIFDRSCDELADFQLQTFAEKCQSSTTMISCAFRSENQLSQQHAINSYLVKPIEKHQLLDTLRLFGTDIEHILIVDDDRDFVQLISRMLDNQIMRYTINTAFSGQEAIALLNHRKPDLILLDLEMPGMNGLQVLEKIRADERFSQLPVVIISAREELDSYFVSSSVIEITRTPHYNQQELLHWIRSLLA